MGPLLTLQSQIKEELKHTPPFNAIKSHICTAMILGYVGDQRTVKRLLSQLSHTSLTYYQVNKSEALITFVTDPKPFKQNNAPQVRFTGLSKRAYQSAEPSSKSYIRTVTEEIN